jgi:hypothetical protein
MPPVKEADSGGIAMENPIGKCINLIERYLHDLYLSSSVQKKLLAKDSTQRYLIKIIIG